MTTKQLREWLFTNNKEDQWWLSLDGQIEKLALRLDQVDELLKYSEGSSAKALHASQSEMSNPPWIDIDFGSKNISVSQTPAKPAANETLGMLAILMPLIGALLNVFWVGNMNLLQGPGSTLNVIVVIVVVGSAILIGMEASQIGIGSESDSRVKNGKRVTGPAGWAVGTMLMWVIGFPAYMYVRSKFGLKNMVVGALAAAVLFVGTTLAINSAIEERMSDIKGMFSR